MPIHPPIVRRFIAPTAEQAAESRSAVERVRAEAQAKREGSRPARRAAILAGPALGNVDAAVECSFACDPRPADVSLHEERQKRFDAAAAAMKVEARIEVPAAPFVIVGTCDGRGFYLRERHGRYRVTIAPDEDPGSDPWTADSTETSIDVAAGDDDELVTSGAFSPAAGLRIAVTAVRTALARNACPPPQGGLGPLLPCMRSSTGGSRRLAVDPTAASRSAVGPLPKPRPCRPGPCPVRVTSYPAHERTG